jgi:hypothetical protein
LIFIFFVCGTRTSLCAFFFFAKKFGRTVAATATTAAKLVKKRKEYQLIVEACAACGATATAIPNPPAIIAPIIARSLRI